MISHLRAAYLQSFQDGVGERLIKPSHLYITKTGPKDLNWAANTLLSMASPSSPPIPVDSFNERVVQFRRGKASLSHSDSIRKPSLRRQHTKRGRSATYPEIAPPTLHEDDEHSLVEQRSVDADLGGPAAPRDDPFTVNQALSSDDLINQLNRTQLDESDSLDEEDEEDEDDDGLAMLEDSGEDEDYSLLVPEDGFYSDSSLSGLSEGEDDSAIEEDMEYATQQMKSQMFGDENTPSSSVLLERSPRRRATTTSSSSSGFVNLAPTNSQSLFLPSPAPIGNGGTGSRRGTTSSLDRPVASTTSAAAQQRRLSAASRPRTKTNDSLPTGSGGLNFDKSLKSKASIEGDLFPKKDVNGKNSGLSALSSLIKMKQSTFDNPLEQYINASGKSERRPLKLIMYMPCCSEPKRPWEVLVRRDVNVSNAIGFALYRYVEDGRLPPLKEEMKDSNRWNLRIVEEDGEPDDDFPALDRTRAISAYSFDEFALVEATPAQVKENEKVTPNSKKPIIDRTASMSKTGPPTLSGGKKNSAVPVTVVIYEYPYDDVVSKPVWSSDVLPSISIQSILDAVCRDRELNVNDYFLKLTSSREVLSLNAPFSTLGGRILELTPKRVITSVNGYSNTDILSLANAPAERATAKVPSASGKNSAASHRTVKKSTSTGNLSLSYGSTLGGARRNSTGASSAEAPTLSRQSQGNRLGDMTVKNELLPGGVNGVGYEKYTVWRRQPMSFISRHERVLAIDGEYIHIMPSEDRTWFDSPKTSSFHISQVLKVKQSHKVPNNFKVVVMKTSGPKRYDLEALDPNESAIIVNRIKSLAANYKK